MSITELNRELYRNATALAQICIRKLIDPSSPARIKKAESHAEQLGKPLPISFNKIPFLNKGAKGSIQINALEVLASLCLDYPHIFEEVVKELKGDAKLDNLRRGLAQQLASAGQDIGSYKVRIHLLGKLLSDSDQAVRIFAVRGLTEFGCRDDSTVRELLSVAVYDKSEQISKPAMKFLR